MVYSPHKEFTMNEIWKSVKGLETFYEISNFGKVRSLEREGKTSFGARKYGGNEVKHFVGRNGYPAINLTKKGFRKQFSIHRLVLESFVGDCPVGMEACHRDGNRLNVNLSNLRWDTRSNNALDKRNHATWQGGEKSSTSKLKIEQVRFIRENQKESNKSMAEKFNVSVKTISKVKTNETWKFAK